MPTSPRKIRYAVVGLGHIAQVAVLPAFAQAENSELVALVSGDHAKRKQLARRYRVPETYSYNEYDSCLANEAVDAVYIALPNHLHCEYAIRAARHGVHILCEKPMAITVAECDAMIKAAEQHRVKLMIAYRLHFEEANLAAAEIAHSGQLGKLRLFHSVFTMQTREDNIRLKKRMGGGTLYDIGIYCINAARSLFRAEPLEISAFAVRGTEKRFQEVDEMTTAILRFPNGRLAAFTTSFGATDVSLYDLVGTEGRLRVEPAYEYVGALKHQLTVGGRTSTRTFAARDQFAPELLYFSDCLLKGKNPEPSGEEGRLDVRIIEALYQSAARGKSITLQPVQRSRWPTVGQEIRRPPVKKSPLINVKSPSL